jgi:hypothetical protein
MRALFLYRKPFQINVVLSSVKSSDLAGAAGNLKIAALFRGDQRHRAKLIFHEIKTTLYRMAALCCGIAG